MSFEDFLFGSVIVLSVATVLGVTLTWLLLLTIIVPYFYFISHLRASGPQAPASQSLTSIGATDYLRRRSMSEEHHQ